MSASSPARDRLRVAVTWSLALEEQFYPDHASIDLLATEAMARPCPVDLRYRSSALASRFKQCDAGRMVTAYHAASTR